MFKNIIDDLKNQDIEVDLAQSNLILQMIDALPKEKSFIQKLKKNKTQKMGFYIWGEVGRGKTVITKCFLNHLNYEWYFLYAERNCSFYKLMKFHFQVDMQALLFLKHNNAHPFSFEKFDEKHHY